MSTLTVVTSWLLVNDEFAAVLDVCYRLSWKLLGNEVLELVARVAALLRDLANKYGLGNYKTVAFLSGAVERVKRFNDMSMTYKLVCAGVTASALIYWAFAVMNRFFAFAVWPWFLWEMTKVCIHRSVAFYRQSLAFALFFLSLEYVLLPRAPFIVSSLVSVFHLPIVFLGKMGAELVLDLLLDQSQRLVGFLGAVKKLKHAEKVD